MSLRLPHRTAWAIAIPIALWVAVAPFVPELHEALAGHEHVFCLEHHRIEDAEPRRIPALTLDTPAPMPDASIARGPGGLDRRPACVFSSLMLHSAAASPAPRWAPAPPTPRAIQRNLSRPRDAGNVLLLAPKHSPPLA
jgi:hypothetical protein